MRWTRRRWRDRRRPEVRLKFSMRVVATGVGIVAATAAMGVVWWRTVNIGPVQRGADLAIAQGCFGCHVGPSVSPLLPGGFADLDDADPSTLREWILDGIPLRVRQDAEAREALEAAAIRMPAWRGRLSDAQVEDLVAYIRAQAGADLPEDPAARNGHAAAKRLGCFGCHGAGGRSATRNPGSLKGYIPPWDGPDFAELVADDGELREWILSGRPQRLEKNPVARFFLDRQVIRMPAFRGHVTDEELQALQSYIGWLRGAPHVDPRTPASDMRPALR
jgi:mono/diheme cytochrome c family protein